MKVNEILLNIYEIIFKQATTKFWAQYDEITQQIQSELFDYYNRIWLNNTHMVLIWWFNSQLWPWFKNKKYENKIKKEDTFPLYIQNYWLWSVSYFNSLTVSLRSKKNNRPIHFNFWKINWAFVAQLQKCIWTWKSWAPFKAKIAMFSKTIMPVVFLWKDDELSNQEDLLNHIYSLYKNRFYKITLKWIYKSIDTSVWLLKMYNSPLLQQACENKNIKKMVQDKIVKQSESLQDLDIYIDWEEELNLIEKYLKDNWISYEKDDQFWIYWALFTDYLKSYVFFEETILNLIKMRDFWLKDLYENDKFLNDNIFYLDLIHDIYEKDDKIWKKLYKSLTEWNNIKYQENVINSFLTQPDLSNSLELVQDVYQWFLRWLWIGFDDKYIVDINAKMLRYNKDEKENTIFKNINFFNLSKLK